MDSGTFRGLITLVLLLMFIGIWLWAWSGKRKKSFEQAAQLPLDDAPHQGGTGGSTRSPHEHQRQPHQQPHKHQPHQPETEVEALRDE